MFRPVLYQAVRRMPKLAAGIGSAFRSHGALVRRMIAQGQATDRPNLPHATPVLMGLGIAAYFWLPGEPPALWPPLVLAACGIALVVARRLRPEAATGLGVLTCVALGFALASFRTTLVASPQVTQMHGHVPLVGRVISVEPGRRSGQRILLDATVDLGAGPTPLRLRVTSPRVHADLTPGQWIRWHADLRPLPAPARPDGFDFARKLWFEGVRGLAFTLDEPETVEAPTSRTGVAEQASDRVRRLRDHITGRILAATDERTGPIAAAFLSGERSGIAEDDNDAMQASSLSHLLSISGLHMMLAGFGVFAALRLMACLIPALAGSPYVKKAAAAIALVASLAYLLLSGASIPTQRAFVTVAIAFLAILTDRNAISMRTVALGATLILLLTPEAWMDPSFQMSFCAVMMLVAAYEWWSRRRLAFHREDGWVRRIVGAVVGTAVTSLVAGVATAPFAAYHFNRVSLYGLAANVLVMPLVSLVIMPFGVIALVVMPFGLEWGPLQVMDKGLALMLDVAHVVAAWPMAVVGVPAFPVEALLAMSLGLAWLAGCQATWRWLGLAPIAIALLVAAQVPRPDIIVDSEARNVAIRTEDGLLSFASSRRARFNAEIWLRADGDTREVGEAVASVLSPFDCTRGPCMAEARDGRRVALVRTDGELEHACRHAHIVVARIEVTRPCTNPELLVDSRSLARSGAVAVQLTTAGLQVVTVAERRGNRPWVAPPE